MIDQRIEKDDCKENEKTSSENNPSNMGVNEMIIEDLKTIESSSFFLHHELTEINRRAKQARQLLEIQVQYTKQSQIKPEPPKTEPPTYHHSFSGGPWSNALREKYFKALREKHGIKMREGYE